MNTTFLKCILAIVIMSLLNAACKKLDFKPEVTYTTLKVLELGTNLPVAGAEVKIYECNSGFGGCADLIMRKTVTTDKDGNFQFDSQLHAYLAVASQSKYWTGSSGGDNLWGGQEPVTNIFLTPVAYTTIHMKEVNPHPVGMLITINVAPDSSFIFGSAAYVKLPADTTFTLESYGNRNNVVTWNFTDSMGTYAGGQLPVHYINRFDTVSVEINY